MKINKKSKEGIKKKVALISLAALMLNAAMLGIFIPSESVPQVEACHPGKITVCKIIIDGEGNIVNGSENAGTFLIPGISSIAMPDTSFTTPLSLIDNVIGSDDAECFVHNNLPLGSYWYGEEIVIGDNWSEPKYNDQFTDTVTTLGDFYEYEEPGNNQNADGNIVLTSDRPDRTLVVLNEYKIPAEEVIVVASKVICDDEADLPDWGGNVSPVTGEPSHITSTTAQDYVNDSNGKCRLAEGWSFQVGENKNDGRPIKYPGDYYGEATTGDGWTTFGPTDSLDGKIQTTVTLTEGMEQLRLREVLQDGYIPFTYDDVTKDNSNDVSAEFYCSNDIHVYDNYDYIRDPQAGETYYCVAFNTLIYAPHCGDGIKNQEWEECDGADTVAGKQCTAQCQFEGDDSCSDLVLARVNVSEAWNDQGGAGNMTSDIYLGSATNSVPAGTWFELYYNGSYVNDTNIYEDVPGLAIQRLDGSVRAVIYGSAGSADIEHINGNIEFYNASITEQKSDDSGNNRLEKGFDTVKGGAGDDEVWMETGDNNHSYFWLTVNTADDGYYTDWEIIEDCVDTCSIFGHKYDYLGAILEGWIIGLANIIDCVTGDEWADSVVSYSPVGTIADDRDDPEQALDATDYDETNGTYNFVSLGIGGELVLEFDNLILNGTGDDIEVVETSWGSPTCQQYPERINVYASQNGVDWEDLGSGCLDSTFDLGGLDWAKYVKINDVTVLGENNYNGDGYDVDAVKAIHCGNYETVVTTETDEYGEYCFADVDAGDYVVYEEMKSGWSIWDVFVGGQSVVNYFVDSFFDVFVEVEVVDGETITVDFYNQEDAPETNEPPVADAGVDQTVTVGTIVDFDGSASYDTDGTIVSYDWNFDDGDTGTGETTTHTYATTGTYEVVLTVTDDDNATGTNTVQIIVEDGNGLVCTDGDEETCYNGPAGTEGVGICHAGTRICTNNVWGECDGEVTPQGEICGNGIDENCDGVDSSCRGGGGGGVIIQTAITIDEEKISCLDDGGVLVEWTTNTDATDQVAYGDSSVTILGDAPEYGYDFVNARSDSMHKKHEVTIAGLANDVTHYFRPISDKEGTAEVTGKELSISCVIKEEGEVKGTDSPVVCNYLLEYIKLRADNNPVEVKKLETFLNEFENENLAVNGIYEQVDFDAVSRFQEKYLEDVLSPWSHNEATGYVYITTKKKINEIYCQSPFPLTAEQEVEVARYSSRYTGYTAPETDGEETEEGVEVSDFIIPLTVAPSEEPAEEPSEEEVGEAPQEEEGAVAGAEDEVVVGDEDDETVEDDKKTLSEMFESYGGWKSLLALIIIIGTVYYFAFYRRRKVEREE